MRQQPRLAGIFRAHLPADVNPRGDDALCERVLDAVVAQAREAAPAVRVAPEDFIRYLAERFPRDAGDVEALQQAPIRDLYIACGCVSGDAAALSEFEKGYLAKLDPVLARRASAMPKAEVKQAVREKLLVRQGDGPPKIAEYTGRGSLVAWVRVVGTRVALNLARGVRREIALDEDAMLAERTGGDDAEIAHLKKLYKDEFATAFREALGTLEPRDRNLLRQHYVDGVAMAKIGALYRVHRVTVVHWINDARARLADETHRRLAARLRASETEVESILRLVRSQLDVSLRSYLK